MSADSGRRMDIAPFASSGAVPQGWKPRQWSLYCAFAVFVLRDLGDHEGLLLDGLPEPERDKETLTASEDLTGLYSKLDDPEDVKALKKVYTPAPVVEHVLKRLDYPREGEGHLLDPACGTGAFLAAAARRYLHTRTDATWEGLAGAVRGIDLDPVAVLIARARVLGAALDAGLEVGSAPLRIACGDALSSERSQASLFDGEAGGPLEGGAGYVVGNPPYGKVHSSDARLGPYRHTVYGHANLYGVFLALSADQLREGGRIGFVVPRSFASGLYFKNLRRYLLNELRFDEVDVFGSRNGVFPGVLQETLLLLATKGGQPGPTVVREPRDPQALGSGPEVCVPEGKLSLGPRFDHSLVLSANPVAHEVLMRVRQHSKPLADHGLKASTGKLVWNRHKEHLRHGPELGARRVYWPANVRPWAFDPGIREMVKPNWAIPEAKTFSAMSHPEDLVITKRISAKEQDRRIEACFVPADHPELDARGFFWRITLISSAASRVAQIYA